MPNIFPMYCILYYNNFRLSLRGQDTTGQIYYTELTSPGNLNGVNYLVVKTQGSLTSTTRPGAEVVSSGSSRMKPLSFLDKRNKDQ